VFELLVEDDDPLVFATDAVEEAEDDDADSAISKHMDGTRSTILRCSATACVGCCCCCCCSSIALSNRCNEEQSQAEVVPPRCLFVLGSTNGFFQLAKQAAQSSSGSMIVGWNRSDVLTAAAATAAAAAAAEAEAEAEAEASDSLSCL
jgi:hypothetical protein